MIAYEKYLKNLDENKLLEALEVWILLEKKYWKWYLNLISDSIEKADKEIFDILKIFRKLELNSWELKNLKNLISSNQAQKYIVSSSEDIKPYLEGKIENYQPGKIISKLGVKIQSQNLWFQRSLESDLEKLLGN